MMINDPASAAAWISEDELAPPGTRSHSRTLSFSMESAQVFMALEFASNYDSEKFRKLDRTFGDRGIPYSIYLAAALR